MTHLLLLVALSAVAVSAVLMAITLALDLAASIGLYWAYRRHHPTGSRALTWRQIRNR